MRFITPELLADPKDPAALSAHEDRWDEMCERYQTYVREIEGFFPPGLRHLADHYLLHDAVVHLMGRRDGAFVLLLELDSPLRPWLTLTFDLVGPPAIIEGILPPERRRGGTKPDWLYDELELVPGEPPTWRQSILLSNGWEVTLHFRDVRVEEFQPLIPASADAPAVQPA